MRDRRECARRLVAYTGGALAWASSRSGPAYALVVPADGSFGVEPLGITVVVHGTLRHTHSDRTRVELATLANEQRRVLLFPLFPVDPYTPDGIHNYKLLDHGGLRYDLVLLDLVEEVAALWGLRADRFLLHGFSGGAQFAHRFLYLHPHRLEGVCVAAPGRVTLLDGSLPWPHGIADARDRFGVTPDLAALRQVPVRILVGSSDVATEQLAAVSTGAAAEWEARTGRNRLERAHTLASHLREHGVAVTLEVVDGPAHDEAAMLPAITRALRGLDHV